MTRLAQTFTVTVAVALLLGGCAPGLTFVSKDYIARVQQSIATVWPRMGQIWPDVDFSQLTLLLVDGTSAYEINAKGYARREYSEVSTSIPLVSSEYGFAKLTWNGTPAIAIQVSGSALVDLEIRGVRVPSIFAFATHEAFHLYGQAQKWKGAKNSNGLRAARYPVEAKPRLYRYMMFQTLLQAIQNPALKPQRLSVAAGWYQRWKREYTDEASETASTDLFEGTAEYVTAMATTRAAVGFEASPAQLRQAMLETIYSGGTGTERFVSPDLESYPLGVVAGFLADESTPNWKSEAQDGTVPIDTLLKGTVPIDEVASPEAIQRVTDSARARQNAAAPFIEPFLNRLRDPSSVLLAVPFSSMVGTFLTEGFYQVATVPYKPIIAPLTATFRLSGRLFELKNITVAVGSIPECSTTIPQILLPLGANEVRFSGTQATINTQGFIGDLSFNSVKSSGKTVLCAK